MDEKEKLRKHLMKNNKIFPNLVRDKNLWTQEAK